MTTTVDTPETAPLYLNREDRYIQERYQKDRDAWLAVSEGQRCYKKAKAVYDEAAREYATWVSVRVEQALQAQTKRAT